MKQSRSIIFLLVLVITFSCRGRQTASSVQDGDTVSFRYATQLIVVRHQGYTVAELQNPWKPGKTLHTYILVPRDSAIPNHLPHGTLLRTPLTHSAVFTTVHCALLGMLHHEDALAGVADLKYIKLPWVHQRVASGRIADFGEGMSPVLEKIIDCHPDAIFLSPFENSGGYGRLEDIDIPIVECAEYMEQSPLARAEWMRFYGMLFGCERQADSLFAMVDSSYQALKALASQSPSAPSVVVDKVTGSVWYVPGGRSTIGQMMADAHATYAYADDDHSGSVALPFESVLEHAGTAAIWHFRYSADHDISFTELLGEHPGYAQFAAFQTGSVYACDVSLPSPRYYHKLAK